MKLTLVQAPVITRLHDMLAPPLGLLTIAAILRDHSVDVEIVDLNLAGFLTPEILTPSTFYDTAARRIAATNPDIVGFTSMALESHVCLELARRLKTTDPGVITLFGGPHFSAIARELLTRFPWVDYVVTGEGERATLELLNQLRDDRSNGRIVNVAHRTRSGVQLDRQLRGGFSLEELPFPAYDLLDLEPYFKANPTRLFHIEHARGCQLRCSFCYSEAHWGHGETAKSHQRTIDELVHLRSLGARTAFFVADNFITRPGDAQRLCAEIEEAKLGLRWTCYATLAPLDATILEAMGRAGCRSVFVGVDAVSPINKKTFRKTYYKGWEPLREKIDQCLANEVQPMCSFMLSSADSAEGIEATLQTAAFARHIGADVTLNALAIYSQTELAEATTIDAPTYSELKPRLHFDTPEVNFVNPYAKHNPELFPLHQSAPENETMGCLYRFTHVARQLILRNPLTMTRYALDSGETLSSLVRHVSENLGDTLEEGRGLHEFDVYQRALNAALPDLASNGSMASVLLYELAQKRRKSNLRPLRSFQVEDQSTAFRINSFQLLSFNFDLDRINHLTPLTHDGCAEDYLVVNFKNRSHALKLGLFGDPTRILESLEGTETAKSRTFTESELALLKKHYILLPDTQAARQRDDARPFIPSSNL